MLAAELQQMDGERSRAMRKLGVGATVLAVLLLTASAFAAVGATIVLTNGQRVRADIFDMNAQGVVGRVNGSERSWSTGEIAVIDFAGDGNNFPSNELDRAGSGLLVLRDGSLVSGRLVDIGGSNPLRISFAGRDYSSSDVARIYFSRPAVATALPAQPAAPLGGSIRVPASGGWVSSGITVIQGEPVYLVTTGEVHFSADPNDVATPAGAKNGKHAPRSPLPSSSAGALIGRVGNGRPFGIGDQRSFPAPATGLLYLTVNDDDQRSDNSGEFVVTISTNTSPYRRR
jgi:hypothetical protein